VRSPFGQEGNESCRGDGSGHVAKRGVEPKVVFRGPNTSPAAVRSETCLTCHTPHGSNEPRPMKSRMNFLCASCHSAQGNFSGGAVGASSIPNRGPAAAAQAFDEGITIGNTTARGLVGIGVMGVAGTNPNQAGRYHGFNTTGVNGGSPLIEIAGRPVWDPGSTRYAAPNHSVVSVLAGAKFPS
jgi:predicted CXXCH cytochrome family protein